MYPEGLRQVIKTVVDPENMPAEKVVLSLRSLEKGAGEEWDLR
ncbi:MAG: hypothetical protein QXP68_01665 [Thermosphaera sp.]